MICTQGRKQTFNDSENRLGFHDFSARTFDMARQAKQTDENTIPKRELTKHARLFFTQISSHENRKQVWSVFEY